MPSPVPPPLPSKRPPVVRVPTMLETSDEIFAAIQAAEAERLAARRPPVAETLPHLPTFHPPVAQAPGSPTADASDSPKTLPPRVRLFKPSVRPPIALLHVFDDGDNEGEIVRLRCDRFVIGQTEGDLVLPHDKQIAGRHAELVRQKGEDESWVWVLNDLGSTTGTFVRAGAAILKDGQEFLVGRTRYRLDSGEPGGSATGGLQSNQTPVADAPGSPKEIVEMTPAGPGARVPLLQTEYWIGADPTACAIVPVGDPFVSPRHARLSRDAKGRWHINNNKSVNGVWVRVEQMELASSCQFQIGEQRFSFKVPRP